MTMPQTTSAAPLPETDYVEIYDDQLNVTTDISEVAPKFVPYIDRIETYIVPVIFSLILITGFLGNGLVCFIILRHKEMRTIPNMYVLSVAVGDLLVLATTLPFTASIYITESWPFGELMCKITESAKDVSIAVSVFTLTALSADRYFAIRNPMRKWLATDGRYRVFFTVAVMVLIWTLALLCAIPASFAYIKHVNNNKTNESFSVCYPFPEEFGPNYPKIMVIFHFFIYYVIPLCIIGIFYVLMARRLVDSTRNIIGQMQGQASQVQARRRVAKMVIIFVAVFAICFLPIHIYMMWFHLNPRSRQNYSVYWHVLRILSFCLAYSNSCVNPIALYCVGGAFRVHFDRYLFCREKRRVQHERSSDTSGHSRVRGQSFSPISLRKYLSESREQREAMSLSVMASDIRPATPVEEQETSFIVSSNGVDESLQKGSSTEPSASDRLIT